MARAKAKTVAISGFNWKDSYSVLILGGIVAVILGLLVANFIMRRNQDIGTGEKTQITKQEQQQAAAEAKSGSDYKIASGDSLSSISEKAYGSMDFWPAIARVNNLANPNVILADTSIKLPAKNEVEEIKNLMATASYAVKEGDTLFVIAEKVYGNGWAWPTIARANGVLNNSQGNPLIFTGSTLAIPR